MAEDSGEKTEAPTPRRRQEAREEGQVARSADLTAAILLLSVFVLMRVFGPGLVKAMRAMVQRMLSEDLFAAATPNATTDSTLEVIVLVAKAVAPMLISLMVIAVAANLAQVGLHFTTKPLQPNLAALSPMRGLSRLRGQGLMKLAMNLLKLLLVGFVGYTAVASRMPEIVAIGQLSFAQIFTLGAGVVYAIALRLGITLLILALLDYLWARYQHERQLRMTKQEVKEEMRRMEGDPKTKQRRRQIAMKVHVQRLRKAVPTADVIVTNPTELAIALKYDADSMHAPRVVAKGAGYMAARIREIAIENGIPILERKPLARALYKLVDVGREIPEQFYSTVAEILAYVYELTGKIKRKAVA